MIMICWFYCFDFAKFLYFASAPVLFVFSLFVLKRGLRHGKPHLRETAFALMFISTVKMCIFDLRMLKKDIFCADGAEDGICTRSGLMMIEISGLVALLCASYVLFHYYRLCRKTKKVKEATPEETGLSLWANITMTMVVAMVVWQVAPWVGYLTIGRTPGIFTGIPWQALAVVNLILLLVGFWKAESCVWVRTSAREGKMKHLNKTWTPRDTLWMAVFIYLVTLALSYVAHDVLARGVAGI